MNRTQSFGGRARQLMTVAAGAALVGSLTVLGVSSGAGATVNRNYMATYNYSSVNYYVNGDTTAYPQTQFITMDPCTGTFAGPGTEAYGNSLVTVTDIVYDSNGNSIGGTYTVQYLGSGPLGMTNYEVWVTMTTINPDGSYSGTWFDNLGGTTPNETGTVIALAPTTTWYSVHGQYVAAMGGGKSAAKYCVGMPVQSQSQK